MANTSSNRCHEVVLQFTPLAFWNFVDVSPNTQAAAKPFGRHVPSGESGNGSAQRLPDISTNPVLYLPVSKRRGTERFPSLSLNLLIVETPPLTRLSYGSRPTISAAGSPQVPPQARQSVCIPGVEGTRVEFEIANVWLGDVWTRHDLQPEKLEGRLKADLTCEVIVPPDVVQRWFHPRDGKLDARVNENLLEFRWRLPDKAFKGMATTGASGNRIFLYRKKVMVFIPGVFGSSVRVQTADGQIYGFPDLDVNDAQAPRTSQEAMAESAATLVRLLTPSQQIGALECDSKGAPLAEPLEPKLLMLSAFKRFDQNVYDPFEQLREARLRRISNVPAEFILFEVHVYPYDWRCDLTETALKRLDDLGRLQQFIRKNRPDTDDEIAVAGHSTGGVIIRRMLAEPSADGIISQAFFLNVPFRGAAKPMSVLLTGRDPFAGAPMIPFVNPESLQSIGFTAPVVYHLATTNRYVQPPGGKRRHFVRIRAEGFETHEGMDAEALKRAWIRLAVETRFIGPRRIVPDGQLHEGNSRRQLAFEADRWAKLWNAHLVRMRAVDVSDVVKAKLEQKLHSEILKQRLEGSAAARSLEVGWNEGLAKRAEEFHEVSERAAASGKWKDKAYIFYSLAIDKTTIGVYAEQVERKEHVNVFELLRAAGRPTSALSNGKIDGLVPEPEQKLDGLVQYEHWSREGSGYARTVYKLFTVQGSLHGDGTVPIRSLLGFGGKAKVFRRLLLSTWKGRKETDTASRILKESLPPLLENKGTFWTDLNLAGHAGPGHVQAPNHPWAWDRIIEVFQGIEVDEHLEHGNVNTTSGEITDPEVEKLRKFLDSPADDDRREQWAKAGVPTLPGLQEW